MRASRRALGAAVLTAAAGRAARAQSDFPGRPLRIIVAYAPGGSTDLIARLIADRISGPLGQPAVVENRPGAAGIVGTEAVARAAPDGHTLLMATNGTHGINSAIFRQLSYDPVRDFAPVSLIAVVPLVLVVPAAGPASLAALREAAKARPGAFSYGSAGIGASGHLAGEMLKRMAGLEAEHIPYRGDAPGLADLISGRLGWMFANLPAAIGFVRAGTLKPLAVTSAGRSDALPEVPTMAEAGLAGFQVDPWYGLMAPAGTPAPVVARLQALCAAAVAEPASRERLRGLGAQPVASSAADFAAALQADLARYREVAQAGNISAD